MAVCLVAERRREGLMTVFMQKQIVSREEKRQNSWREWVGMGTLTVMLLSCMRVAENDNR